MLDGHARLVGGRRRIAGLAAGGLALAVFEGFWFVDPVDDGGVQAGEEGIADFGGGDAEELAAGVDQVDAAAGERVVQAGLQADGVVAEDHRVHVVVERHRGVA